MTSRKYAAFVGVMEVSIPHAQDFTNPNTTQKECPLRFLTPSEVAEARNHGPTSTETSSITVHYRLTLPSLNILEVSGTSSTNASSNLASSPILTQRVHLHLQVDYESEPSLLMTSNGESDGMSNDTLIDYQNQMVLELQEVFRSTQRNPLPPIYGQEICVENYPKFSPENKDDGSNFEPIKVSIPEAQRPQVAPPIPPRYDPGSSLSQRSTRVGPPDAPSIAPTDEGLSMSPARTHLHQAPNRVIFSDRPHAARTSPSQQPPTPELFHDDQLQLKTIAGRLDIDGVERRPTMQHPSHLCKNFQAGRMCASTPCPYHHGPRFKRQRACIYLVTNESCRYADNCHFSHDPDAIKAEKELFRERNLSSGKTPCRNFQHQKACHRNPCPYEHDQASLFPGTSPDKTRPDGNDFVSGVPHSEPHCNQTTQRPDTEPSLPMGRTRYRSTSSSSRPKIWTEDHTNDCTPAEELRPHSNVFASAEPALRPPSQSSSFSALPRSAWDAPWFTFPPRDTDSSASDRSTQPQLSHPLGPSTPSTTQLPPLLEATWCTCRTLTDPAHSLHESSRCCRSSPNDSRDCGEIATCPRCKWIKSTAGVACDAINEFGSTSCFFCRKMIGSISIFNDQYHAHEHFPKANFTATTARGTPRKASTHYGWCIDRQRMIQATANAKPSNARRLPRGPTAETEFDEWFYTLTSVIQSKLSNYPTPPLP